MRVTRRRFLTSLGAVGGAGVVLGAMEALDLLPQAETAPFEPPSPSDFTLQGRANDASVLVLGAGVAGLAAAYELEKAGYRVEVVEAQDRPGGRSWTVRDGATSTEMNGDRQRAELAGDLYFNAGPARIAQHHVTLEYCRELGVPVEVFVNGNRDAWYFHEQRSGAVGELTGRPIRQRAARADLLRGLTDVFAKVTRAGALDAELSDIDQEALLELLAGLGVASRGYEEAPGAGLEAGTAGAPSPLPDLLRARFGRHLPFEHEWDQAMPMFQPVGGMDRLPHALADALRGPIRYGAAVERLTIGGDGVEVVTTDGDVHRAGHCICALPPSVLRQLETNLPANTQHALSHVQMLAAGKVGLQYRRRFWETDERILGGITWTNLDIGTIWYPSSGYLAAGGGVLVGAYNFGADAETFARMSHRQRIQRTVEQGAKIHGDPYVEELVSAFSVAWSEQPFSQGAWALWADRGTTYRRLLEPAGPVHFAGDHLSYTPGWQHGALESARAAVTALHRSVLA